MNKLYAVLRIFLFIFTLSVLILSSLGTGITGGSVIVVSDYGVNNSSVQPSIVYAPGQGEVPFSSAVISSTGDNATVYLNTSWTSGIYTDDNGNTYWITTSGNVSVFNAPSNFFYYLPSIPSKYVFAPFTSVASVNYSSFEFTVLLNEKGFAYAYNGSNSSWFNATLTWGLNLTEYPGPWTSVTSNVMRSSYYGHNTESFFFVSYSGAVAKYNVGNQTYRIFSKGQNLAIISAVANWNETEPSSGELYGLEWNGSVYDFNNSWQYWGNVFGSPGSGAVSITIGYDPTNGNQNLFVSIYQNSSYLNESNNQAGAPSSGGFFETGTPAFSSGTVESLTFDNYDYIFYEAETNGTIAYSYDLTTWYYITNAIPATSYSDVVSIQWKGAPNANPWTAYAEFQSYTTPWDSLAFNISFSSNRTGYEYNYSHDPNYLGSSLMQPVKLSPSYTVKVSYTGYPNMMGNSTFSFAVTFTYPMNSSTAVAIVYNLTFVIINHFYYQPVA